MRCLWVVLPAAVCWGASFPLALAAVGGEEKDPARLVGTVYAANTVGGIVGALFGSLLIIAWLGTQTRSGYSHRRAAISALVALAADAALKRHEPRLWMGARRGLATVALRDRVGADRAAAARRLRSLVRHAI